MERHREKDLKQALWPVCSADVAPGAGTLLWTITWKHLWKLRKRRHRDELLYERPSNQTATRPPWLGFRILLPWKCALSYRWAGLVFKMLLEGAWDPRTVYWWRHCRHRYSLQQPWLLHVRSRKKRGESRLFLTIKRNHGGWTRYEPRAHVNDCQEHWQSKQNRVGHSAAVPSALDHSRAPSSTSEKKEEEGQKGKEKVKLSKLII